MFLHIKSLPNLLFGVLCLPGDQSHPFAQPTINPLACCICWTGLLGCAVFPPWNEGPNFGSYKLKFMFIVPVMLSSISSSDILFPFFSQSFPALGTFPMSHLFTPNDQNTGASTSASVLPVNTQGLSPLKLTGLIFLLSKGLSGVFSSTTVQR